MKRFLLGLLTALALGAPALAAAKPIPIKVVILTTFEAGADTGDRPGEFQAFAERMPLTGAMVVPGIERPVRYSKDGVLGVVTGMRARPRESIAALISGGQFDVSHAYWIVAGIAGVDPAVASVGSAAWARYVVDADPIYEVDERDAPADWPYGLYANDAERPNVKGKAEGSSAMVWTLDRGLIDWAYGLTQDVKLPDNAALQAVRAPYKDAPAGQRPPFVLQGDALGTVRFWHGHRRTQWAEDWVKLWTDGAGTFTMTDCEDQGILDVLDAHSASGKIDRRRVLVLRTGSNYSRAPLGQTSLPHVFHEESLKASFFATFAVGGVVARELVAHWDRYASALPTATSTPASRSR